MHPGASVDWHLQTEVPKTAAPSLNAYDAMVFIYRTKGRTRCTHP